MFRLMVGLSLILVLAVGFVVFSAEEPQLALLSKAELCATVGGGCDSMAQDPGFCSGRRCDPVSSKWYEIVGTEVMKRWCESGPGVCDCNQEGITRSVCTNSRTCNEAGCNDCGAWSASAYVKTACNMDGATCTSGAQCE